MRPELHHLYSCEATGVLENINNQFSGKKNVPICSIFQFSWCKASLCGLFQAINLTSLDRERGKDVCSWHALVWASSSTHSVRAPRKIVWKSRRGFRFLAWAIEGKDTAGPKEIKAEEP